MKSDPPTRRAVVKLLASLPLLPDALRSRFIGPPAGGPLADDVDFIPLVPLQPEPVETMVVRTPSRDHTAIMRLWNPGDVAHCRLCPVGRCVARGTTCLLMIRGDIGVEEADLFDATKLNWPPLPKGGGR